MSYLRRCFSFAYFRVVLHSLSPDDASGFIKGK